MAIEWMDNFSQYGTDETKMTDGIYAAVTDVLATDPDGVSSGKVMNGGNFRRVLSAAKTTVGVGFRLWMSSLPSSTADGILAFKDADNAYQVSLTVTTTGIIQVRRGQYNATILGATAVPALVAGAWSHIETKVLFSQTVGTVEVRVNGAVILNLTGLDTVATSNVECSQITCYAASVQTGMYFKDLICWNADGSQNNDFLGDVQIVTLLPTSDDTFTGWASTGANGFSVIDETTPSDADYITAEAADTTAAVFGLSDIDPDITVVKGLMTVVRALKTDSGTATLQVALVSNGDLDNGADRAITTAATYWMDVSELDPDTASAWTPTTVNAAKLSLDRTS